MDLKLSALGVSFRFPLPGRFSATRFQVLDVIGLAMTACRRSLASRSAGPHPGVCRPARRCWAAQYLARSAALVNGALSQALEYDDTMTDRIKCTWVTRLPLRSALAEKSAFPAEELWTAIADWERNFLRIGACPRSATQARICPTGLFATFGSAWAGSAAVAATGSGNGQCGRHRGQFCVRACFECWVDGTQSEVPFTLAGPRRPG